MLNKPQKIDFRYSIDFDYDYDGEENQKIVCIKIKESHIDKIVNDLMIYVNKKFISIDKDIIEYGMDRIARFFKLYESNKYEVIVSDGYYGEEVDGVHLINNEEEIKIKETIDNFLKSDNRIEFLLNLEYEYVLPELVGKTWSVKIVNYSDVDAGQKDYLMRVKRNDNPYNNTYKGIVAICLPVGFSKYRLIDGYHRFAAKKNSNKIKILVGE